MADTRRQIIFLIPSLRGGGAERVIVTLLRHLDRKKFRLRLAVIDMREAAYLDDVPDDVELIDLSCSRVRYALPKIIRVIWRQRPEVVFSTLGHLNLALAIIRPLLPNGVRYIARETSIISEIIRSYSLAGWWRWAYRSFYRSFDCALCQSVYMRNDLVDNFGFPAARAVVIHNPVDIELIRRLAAEQVSTGMKSETGNGTQPLIHLVAAGRLSHEKGFDLLIEALAFCCNTSLRLTILGEGPFRGKLERLAQEKGVAQQVRFAGFQKNPYPFFADADAFVLSSRFEGFPNVVLEALACGTPVIATPAPGGVTEIARLYGGVRVTSSVSTEALSAALLSFISQGLGGAPIMLTPILIHKIISQYQNVLIDGVLPKVAEHAV